jgi:membrane protein DedA with SNARE-associated domain
MSDLAIHSGRSRILWIGVSAAGLTLVAAVAVASPTLLTVIAGTFVSEDLTVIGAGLLVREGTLSVSVAFLGCFLGIYLGDLGLWLLGRFAGWSILERPWFRQRLAKKRLMQLADWFERHGAWAIAASRFLPGTRLPLYVAIGIGGHGGRFARWTFAAALVWTPVLLAASSLLGPGLVRSGSWWALPLAALTLLLAYRLGLSVLTKHGRMRWTIRIQRARRWEFWPTWIFYLPLVPWIVWLMVRHRSATVWTAANPGIPHGGVCGESKFDITSKLPHEAIVPSEFLPQGHGRLATLEACMISRRWSFPLILKPDVGERGAGVKLIRSIEEAERYLADHDEPIVAQTYHPGPFEAGIFYVRLPHEGRGRIFSITDKVFPIVVGDGRSTLEQLIVNHERFRLQSATFLARHVASLSRVPAAGESIRLAIAGNHCQGTLFRDGGHLWTPELEARIDAISRAFDGFFFGRFDVRYSDVEAFRAGRDLAIVELNGVTAESTNIYDPDRTLWQAYRTLAQQWSLLFRIGAANRALGVRPTPLPALLRLIARHLSLRPKAALAD